MSRLLLLLLAASSAAHAGTLMDRLRPHVGEPARITTGSDVLSAKLLSVEPDHFCVEVQIPDFTHERCYSIGAISYFTPPFNDRPVSIAVVQPVTR